MKKVPNKKRKTIKDEKVDFLYAKDDKVLGFHGPMLYEAKVLDRELDVEDGEPLYFVHYQGWNKKWDEQVPSGRLLRQSRENCNYQKELKNRHNKKNKTVITKSVTESKIKEKSSPKYTGKMPSVGKTTSSAKSLEKLNIGMKRSTSKTQVQHSKESQKSEENDEILIPISNRLKKILLKDQEAITIQEKLIKIPCDPEKNIEYIISEVKAEIFKSKGKNFKKQRYEEFTSGLLEYFDQSLPNNLLYLFEQKQFDDFLDNPKPSKIYGINHFLRLFVKLPFILKQTKFSNESKYHFLVEMLSEFVEFLDKYIESDKGKTVYFDASKEYIIHSKQARSKQTDNQTSNECKNSKSHPKTTLITDQYQSSPLKPVNSAGKNEGDDSKNGAIKTESANN